VSSGARALYTPEILGAAAGLAAFPWDEALPLRGEARSRSCGSTIAMALAVDAEGRIARIGLRPHACAVGQAAAHAFATGAAGRNRDDIATARAQIGAWLAGEGALPDWPGLNLIEPARDYPGRHGAIVLAWDAALAALS
jgi:NifU-like protein involved in Fe-S cluster formation